MTKFGQQPVLAGTAKPRSFKAEGRSLQIHLLISPLGVDDTEASVSWNEMAGFPYSNPKLEVSNSFLTKAMNRSPVAPSMIR